MAGHIEQLKQKVELKFKGDIGTPASITKLLSDIYETTKLSLSMSTVKRLWGKVSDCPTPSAGTLGILAQYAGYNGWDEFCRAMDGENSSDFIGPGIIKSAGLNAGATVCLRWPPDRTCTLRYLGDNRYEVTEQQNSKLCLGATFSTATIANGHPLVATDLRLHPGDEPMNYIAGKTRGVEIIG